MEFPEWFYRYGWFIFICLGGIIIAELVWLVR